MKIGAKLLLGFGGMATLLVGLGVIGISSAGAMQEETQKVTEKSSQADASMESKYAIARSMQMIMELLAADTEDGLNSVYAEYKKWTTRFDFYTTGMRDGVATDESVIVAVADSDIRQKILRANELYDTEFSVRADKIYALQKKLLATTEAREIDALQNEIRKLDDRADAAGRKMLDLMGAVEEAAAQKSMAAVQHSKEKADSAKNLSLGACVIGLIIAIGLSWIMVRSIVTPLAEITSVANRLALGDVAQAVSIKRNDEIGDLAKAFEKMVFSQKEKAAVAEQIALGDLSTEVSLLSEDDRLGKSMASMKESIGALVADASSAAQAAVEGRLNERADAAKHSGAWRRVVEGINSAVGALVGHIDAMPAPAMIIDKEYNVRYMNKMGAKLLGTSQQALIGTKCYNNFKTEDCHTDNCACARAMGTGAPADSETIARPADGMELEISYAGLPVKDTNGEVIGAFEVISDETAVKKAARKAEKRAELQDGEVLKLVQNLQQVALGNFSIDVSEVAGDGETKDIASNFNTLNDALKQVVSAVNALTHDANQLAAAAFHGNLSHRADEKKHSGDFKNVVSGINSIVEAMVQPIDEALTVLTKLSNYDLRARMDGEYEGDFLQIKNALNSTGSGLHDAIAQVRLAVDQVNSAAKQISISSQQVAEGASEQASSLEETTSSMEEMSGMTRQNADNTRQAQSIAETTQNDVVKGSGEMERMVDAMGKIKAASERTAAIIKDINEIAFQTNLLALNAAVEAARAGDAGRGFAVVAEEVRNLAGRAKDAAQNTESLIKESVSLAESGERISSDANKNLRGVAKSVGQVTDIISEITVASSEQARGIEQVNKAMVEMDTVTQRAAANSEESSSAAEELSGQAQELLSMVEKFQIDVSSST